jgi:hypothetical protein
LAKKYQCSPATINKLCKGLVPKYKDKVNDEVALRSELSSESEYLVNTFEKEVNDKLRRENLVYGFQERAVQKAGEILDMTESAKDLRDLVEAVDKAAVTLKVADRHAPKVEVNNTNAQQNNTQTVVFEKISKDDI